MKLRKVIRRLAAFAVMVLVMGTLSVGVLASSPDGELEEGAGTTVVQEQTGALYTVVFYDAGGNVFEQQQVEAGAMLAQPQAVPQVPEGKTFAGWIVENSAEPYAFDTMPVESDMKLFPVYVEASQGETITPVTAVAEADAVPVAESEECTVTFVVDGVVDKTVVLPKETLAPLYTPISAVTSAPFLGWYAEGETAPFGAGRLLQGDVVLTAKFSENLLVTYLDAEGNELEVLEVDASAGDVVYAPAASVKPEAVMGQTFAYWMLEGQSEEYDYNTPLTQSIRLVPKMSSLNLAVFITNGSDVEPQVVAAGGRATAPVPPTRTGYTFAGWFTKENSTALEDKFDFENTKIDGTVFIYAGWTAGTAGYIVNFWAEKANMVGEVGSASVAANRGNYELVYTKQKDGAVTGSTVVLDETTANSEYKSASESVVELLNYSTFDYSDEKVVSGTGQTIVNVYYRRTVFTMNFSVANRFSGNLKSPAGAAVNNVILTNGAGEEYAAADLENGLYTIQYKYGQDISGLWPAGLDISDSGLSSNVFTNWSGFFGNGAAYAGFNHISVPFTSSSVCAHEYKVGRPVRTEATIYPTFAGANYSETRYYYIEVTEQEVRDAGIDPDTLVQNPANATDKYVKWFSNNKTYPGVRYYRFETTGAKSYQVSSPLSSAKNWPGRSIEGYESIAAVNKGTCTTTDFMQVFADPDGNEGTRTHYRINYFMPAQNYQLTLMVNGGNVASLPAGYDTSSSSPVATLKFRQTVELPDEAAVTKVNHEFEGWYLDENFNEKYTGTTMPAKNVTLYAKYRGTEVALVYVDGGVVAETVTYSRNEFFTGHLFDEDSIYNNLSEGQLVPGKGYFQGWYYQLGAATLEFPLDIPLANDKYVLNAVWTNVDYTVTFKGDEGQDDFVVYDAQMVKSGKNTLARSGHVQLVPPARAGYQFKGWSTLPTGDVVNFSTATPVTEDITVYAVWEAIYVTLRYDANGGTLAMAGLQAVIQYGQSLQDAGLALPGQSEVQREGYTFAGWFTAPQGGVAFEGTQKMTVDTTVYAHWKQNVSSTVVVTPDSSSEASSSSGSAPGSSSSTAEESAISTTPATDVLATTPGGQGQPPVNPENTNVSGGLVPLGGLQEVNAWSLLSLLMAIAGALVSVAVFVSMFAKRKSEDDCAEENEEQQEDAAHNRRRIVKTLAVVAGLLVGVVFLVLDNLNNPVVLVNKWTPWIGLVFAAHIVLVLVQAFHRKNNEECDDHSPKTSAYAVH